MVKDTVLLTLNEYNELRDFKKETEDAISQSKFIVIEERNYPLSGMSVTRRYLTTNEAIKELERKVKEFQGKNDKIMDENRNLNMKNTVLKCEVKEMIPINNLKKLNYFQFRKLIKSKLTIKF